MFHFGRRRIPCPQSDQPRRQKARLSDMLFVLFARVRRHRQTRARHGQRGHRAFRLTRYRCSAFEDDDGNAARSRRMQARLERPMQPDANYRRAPTSPSRGRIRSWSGTTREDDRADRRRGPAPTNRTGRRHPPEKYGAAAERRSSQLTPRWQPWHNRRCQRVTALAAIARRSGNTYQRISTASSGYRGFASPDALAGLRVNRLNLDELRDTAVTTLCKGAK